MTATTISTRKAITKTKDDKCRDNNSIIGKHQEQQHQGSRGHHPAKTTIIETATTSVNNGCQNYRDDKTKPQKYKMTSRTL
jgi:hypothetical protein